MKNPNIRRIMACANCGAENLRVISQTYVENYCDKACMIAKQGERKRTRVPHPKLTAERLRELLFYDPETGIFTYRVSRARAIAGNQTSSTRDSSGYLQIGLDRQKVRAHRLAWLYVYGEWPKHAIDHINGVKHDNRIANLRDVVRRINSENLRRAKVTSKSGLLGVYSPSSKYASFAAYIKVNGVRRKIGGVFETAEEAHQAYLAAKRVLHVGCTI